MILYYLLQRTPRSNLINNKQLSIERLFSELGGRVLVDQKFNTLKKTLKNCLCAGALPGRDEDCQ